VVHAADVPLSPPARAAIAADPKLIAAALTAGDDYELLFTAPPEVEGRVAALGTELGVPVTRIGRIEAGTGVRVLDAQGAAIPLAGAGYRHF